MKFSGSATTHDSPGKTCSPDKSRYEKKEDQNDE
jgi:hypothetical protein